MATLQCGACERGFTPSEELCGECAEDLGDVTSIKLAEARALLERLTKFHATGEAQFSSRQDVLAWLAANPNPEAKR